MTAQGGGGHIDWRDRVERAFAEFDTSRDFKTLKKILDDGEKEIQDRVNAVQRKIKMYDDRLDGGFGTCQICPRCRGPSASRCRCNSWVREAESGRHQAYDEAERLQRDAQDLLEWMQHKRGDHLAILKRAHLASPADEDLAKFYYVLKDEDDKEKEEEKRLKRARREEKKKDVDRAASRMNDALREYEERRRVWEKLKAEVEGEGDREEE